MRMSVGSESLMLYMVVGNEVVGKSSRDDMNHVSDTYPICRLGLKTCGRINNTVSEHLKMDRESENSFTCVLTSQLSERQEG